MRPARANFFADPTSVERPAHEGGAGEPRPFPADKLDDRRAAAMRREIVLMRTIAPELWFSSELHGHRFRQARLMRGIHALLMHHHGLASRLLVYTHLPKFLPPRRKAMSNVPRGWWNPPLATLETRYTRALSQAMWEAKKTGLVEVVTLPQGAVRNVPPGRACGTCGLWLSPGDIEAQRCQAPCSEAVTAADIAAVTSGGSSIQDGS
ncbi:MAG: hypothetical protein V2I24_09260 [Halieaceae bacterium]|jgi:hypothetical protein|nr:hypothetical protein [Halieaceae bacterium]